MIREIYKAIIFKFLLVVSFGCALAQEDTTILNYGTYRAKLNSETYQLVISGSPLFYRDQTSPSGWSKINPVWESVADTLFKVEKGIYKVYADTLGRIAFSYGRHWLYSRLLKLIYYDEASTAWFTVQDAQYSKPLISKNNLLVKNIFPNADYKISYQPDNLESFLILSQTARVSLPAPISFGILPTNTWLCLVYALGIGQLNLKFFEAEKEFDWKKGLNSFEFINLGNDWHNPILQLPAQAVIPEISPDSLNLNFPLRKRLVKVGDNFFMLVGMRYEDLVQLSPGQITFDPSIEIIDTSDVFDAYLYSPDTLNRGNDTIFAVGSSATTTHNRGITKYDLSDIPSNATIAAAVDSHYCNAVADSSARIIRALRVTNNWMEMEVNWKYRRMNSADTLWTVAGGDTSDIIDSASVTSAGWYQWNNFTTAVQNWVNGTWENYGLIFKNKDEGSSGTWKRFFTSERTLIEEGSPPTRQPRLYVTYTVPSGRKRPDWILNDEDELAENSKEGSYKQKNKRGFYLLWTNPSTALSINPSTSLGIKE